MFSTPMCIRYSGRIAFSHPGLKISPCVPCNTSPWCVWRKTRQLDELAVSGRLCRAPSHLLFLFLLSVALKGLQKIFRIFGMPQLQHLPILGCGAMGLWLLSLPLLPQSLRLHGKDGKASKLLGCRSVNSDVAQGRYEGVYGRGGRQDCSALPSLRLRTAIPAMCNVAKELGCANPASLRAGSQNFSRSASSPATLDSHAGATRAMLAPPTCESGVPGIACTSNSGDKRR
eukprot:scaffold731_cov261-Pinguiococcus_pyrenoidosus.AAC.78